MRSTGQPLVRPRAGARAAVLLALICAAIAAAWILLGGNGGEHRYRLVFENAGQLVRGNQVQIGGHPVGSIESIDLTDDGLAEVEVSVDRELHEGTTAVIRQTSLAGIANRYISLSPGLDSEPELPDGATIGPDKTTAAVDLDQIFNAFTPRTRAGLSNFIKGQAAVYSGRGREANRSYKFLHPALSQTNRVLDELTEDERSFERFILSSARVFSTLGERSEALASSVANARAAFEAIASENRALDESLARIPPTFRQSNTAFVNLRAALADLDSLVETAKPATKDLAGFLAEVRPVVSDSVPFVTELRRTVSEPGAANDLGELTALLPRVGRKSGSAFRRARRALADFQPVADFARPYAPDMVTGLAKLGQVTGYYDANGHYARTVITGLNLFSLDEATSTLEPAPASQQFAPYGGTRIARRCPGGATQPAADGSNPFYDPPWAASGLSGRECNPDDIPGAR